MLPVLPFPYIMEHFESSRSAGLIGEVMGRMHGENRRRLRAAVHREIGWIRLAHQ